MLSTFLVFFLHIVDLMIDAYLAVLFARMIFDWALVLAPRWRPRGFVATLLRIIYQLTEPPLRFLRRYIKPIPMGPVYFDVSFIVLYFVLIVLQVLI